MFTVPLGLIGVVDHAVPHRHDAERAVGNGRDLPGRHRGQQRRAAWWSSPTSSASWALSVQGDQSCGGRIRFRPIIMTFLATLPRPAADGDRHGRRGSEANVPLARAVVGGLLTSTCLTLFVLPIMYTLLIKDGPDRTWTSRRSWPTSRLPRPSSPARAAQLSICPRRTASSTPSPVSKSPRLAAARRAALQRGSASRR